MTIILSGLKEKEIMKISITIIKIVEVNKYFKPLIFII